MNIEVPKGSPWSPRAPKGSPGRPKRAKGAPKEPKGTPKEPRPPQREPKGPQVHAKGSQRALMGSHERHSKWPKATPKEAKGADLYFKLLINRPSGSYFHNIYERFQKVC